MFQFMPLKVNFTSGLVEKCYQFLNEGRSISLLTSTQYGWDKMFLIRWNCLIRKIFWDGRVYLFTMVNLSSVMITIGEIMFQFSILLRLPNMLFIYLEQNQFEINKSWPVWMQFVPRANIPMTLFNPLQKYTYKKPARLLRKINEEVYY